MLFLLYASSQWKTGNFDIETKQTGFIVFAYLPTPSTHNFLFEFFMVQFAFLAHKHTYLRDALTEKRGC